MFASKCVFKSQTRAQWAILVFVAYSQCAGKVVGPKGAAHFRTAPPRSIGDGQLAIEACPPLGETLKSKQSYRTGSKTIRSHWLSVVASQPYPFPKIDTDIETMKNRFFLTLVFCVAVVALTLRPVSAVEQELEIGSKAPPLDIEYWIQDGNGFFKPVTEFSDGKVYVVEFWATWCGPCIASMPHLAELQKKYRGRGVQIISVSDETPDEVNDLLGKENEQVGKTFAEITSAYSLTTDPDRSVSKAYMEASGQQGIPTSFIVGKTGQIEWIGHPMELEEPLEAVVTDSWDRAKFKADLDLEKEFQRNVEKMSELAGAGKFAEALALADEQFAKATDEKVREQWKSIRYSLKLFIGPPDAEVLAHYRKQLAELKGDANSVGRFGFQFYGMTQQGAKLGALADDLVAAIEAEVEGAEEALKPLLHNTVALLNDAAGKTDAAIKAQQAAIDAATDRQKTRLQPYLEELQKKAGGGKEDETEGAK